VYPYFFCYGRHRGEGCNLPYLAADDVEDQMVEHYNIIEIAMSQIPAIKKKLRAKLDTNTKQRDRMVKRAQVRLSRLTHEKDKLLHAYYRELIDDEQFKPEQDRIGREIKDAHDALAEQDVEFAEVEGIITRALEVAADCQRAYLKAPDVLRQKLNQLFFRNIEIDKDGIARTELTDEMSILIGEEIAPRFERERRELVLAPVGSSSSSDIRNREVLFSGVGSSKTPLVDLARRCVNRLPLLSTLRRFTVCPDLRVTAL
jgi:hypothetical protein